MLRKCSSHFPCKFANFLENSQKLASRKTFSKCCILNQKREDIETQYVKVPTRISRKLERMPETGETYFDMFLSNPQSTPLVTSREIKYPNAYREPRQAWLETMACLHDEKLGMVDLHPDIFAAYPRIDILNKNIHWQRTYKKIDYSWTPSRGYLDHTTKPLRRQKRLGKARNKSYSSPILNKGVKPLGPKGPKSLFYMLPKIDRTKGLCIALSVKYAQNYLHIVDSLEIPTDDPQYIEDLIDTRFWGFSCLFVDDADYMPENTSIAISQLPNCTLMPAYGLNVYSMLKHETLVLTLSAVERLERKLLEQLHKTARPTKFNVNTRYMTE